jgi:hypothetical protein
MAMIFAVMLLMFQSDPDQSFKLLVKIFIENQYVTKVLFKYPSHFLEDHLLTTYLCAPIFITRLPGWL